MNYIIILFIAVSLCSEKKIPKLDLFKDGGVIFKDLNIKTAIPDPRKEGSNKISEQDIIEIKNKSNLFEPSPINKEDLIIISTNKGDMKFKFYSDIAPKTCYNFKKLANSQFYDETLFHRLIKNFIVQGGDILSRDSDIQNDGTGGPGWTLNAEFSDIKHTKGTLSMSRSNNDVNSAGSQFFISLNNNKSLDRNYTVFGYIIEGENVLDLISKVSTEREQMLMIIKDAIPENENVDNWIEIEDKTSNKKYYAKVPDFMNRDTFKKGIELKLQNLYRPGSPIIIKSIRVLN